MNLNNARLWMDVLRESREILSRNYAVEMNGDCGRLGRRSARPRAEHWCERTHQTVNRFMCVGSANEAARAGCPVEPRKNTGPKSRQGRPPVAHGFNRGLRMQRVQSPGGAKDKLRPDRGVLSSLTGLDSHPHRNPAMNRWAILERPCGTWIYDTLNRY